MSPARAGGRPLRVMLADPPVEEEHYIYYQPTMGILYLLGALRNVLLSRGRGSPLSPGFWRT